MKPVTVFLCLSSLLSLALASTTCPDVACSTHRDCSRVGFEGTHRCQNSKCVPSQCGYLGAPMCPSNQTCLLGVCTTGGPGANCTAKWECREGEHCNTNLPYPMRGGYCELVLGTSCTDECRGDFQCDGGKCKISIFRVPGETCGANATHSSRCVLGSCVGGVCTPKQRSFCNSTCSSNGDCLSGFCFQGKCTESGLSIGSTCTSEAQCHSSNCTASKCAGSCDYSISCPEGSYCQGGQCVVQNNGCGLDAYSSNGVCVPYGKLNESCPCTYDFNCVNGTCVEWPGVGQSCEYNCKTGARCLNGTCYALQPIGASCTAIGEETTCLDKDSSCVCGKCKSLDEYMKGFCPALIGAPETLSSACSPGGFGDQDNFEAETFFRMNTTCQNLWANFACCIGCSLDTTYIDLPRTYVDFFAKIILSQIDLSCDPPRLVGRRGCGAPTPSLATVCASFSTRSPSSTPTAAGATGTTAVGTGTTAVGTGTGTGTTVVGTPTAQSSASSHSVLLVPVLVLVSLMRLYSD